LKKLLSKGLLPLQETPCLTFILLLLLKKDRRSSQLPACRRNLSQSNKRRRHITEMRDMPKERKQPFGLKFFLITHLPYLAQPQEPILFPKLRIHFADFPYPHCFIDQRLLTLETCCGYGYGQVRNRCFILSVSPRFSRIVKSASDTSK